MPKNLDNPFSLNPVRVAESIVTVGGEDERSRLRGMAHVREADMMRRNTSFIVKEEKMRGESIKPAFCNRTKTASLRQIETIPDRGSTGYYSLFH